MQLRLLPRAPFAKIAYVWLVYLASPVYSLAVRHPRDATSIVETSAALIAFLPLYFLGYWLEGLQALVSVAGIATIGLLLAPHNPGATVFFVYAGGLAHRVGRPRVAAAVLAALLATIAIEVWLGGLDSPTWAWTSVITALIGGVVIYFADAGGKLRRAEAQAKHMAVIAERERIGRDLHDLLGHTLSVITLKAELASKLAGRDPDRSLAEIRDVERISREALAEVRHAVQGSRLATIIEEIRNARTALDAAGITLACEASPILLSPADEEALALAIREAVTNVIRHSGARACAIDLSGTNRVVRLAIADDGIGGDGPLGYGLSGMRARVSAVGGQLERDGSGGTRLVITLPAGASRRPAVNNTESVA